MHRFKKEIAVGFTALGIAVGLMALSVKAEATPSMSALIEHEARCLTYAQYTDEEEYIYMHRKKLKKYLGSHNILILHTMIDTKQLLYDVSHLTNVPVQALADNLYNRVCSVRI